MGRDLVFGAGRSRGLGTSEFMFLYLMIAGYVEAGKGWVSVLVGGTGLDVL